MNRPMRYVKNRARLFNKFRGPKDGSQAEQLLNSDEDEDKVSNHETFREFLRSKSFFIKMNQDNF